MTDLIGQKLVREHMVTEDQLAVALQRQRIQGGRLGCNLVALGFTSDADLKSFFNKFPKLPCTVEETGLDLTFIAELIMKHILFMGDFSMMDLAGCIKLPVAIIDQAIDVLRREQFVEVKGAAGYAKETYRFAVTGGGKKRANELFDTCQYVGPAPVPVADYNRMTEFQTIRNIEVTEENVRRAFSEIVAGEKLLRRLGPAISSGKAMFIYGPAGNGKTTIAETIGNVLCDAVYIPHSIIVGGQIIKLFDPVTHMSCDSGNCKCEVSSELADIDTRWILIKRPVIKTGGELTLRMLDLDFNPIAKYYEAPLQMKANNGLFIVDDFGRQAIEPHMLLNRWIVPLDRRIDFMSLHTGMKFDIPFDQLVIFSTNIEPRELVDEAFLRRIRYKIKVDHPEPVEYLEIFRRVCASNSVPFDRDVYDYLIDNYYNKLGVKFNACHPRDIIDHMIDDAHYYNHPASMSREGVDTAWKNYFVEM